MTTLYYDADADLSRLTGRRVAIIGYGSQGHAHALSLRDSGVDIRIGLPEGSKSRAVAAKDGLRVVTPAEAAKEADFIVILTPDHTQKQVYDEAIAPNLTKGKTLLFAHGFNIRFGEIDPSDKDIDVIMVAPKAPGHRVREVFTEGAGVPGLVAVHQDKSGHALADALAYAKGIGCTRAGVLETTFAEETETDLFGEQAVLCGGTAALVKAAFETLTKAGYQPELAYFECLHELKLIVDLMYEGGIGTMNYSISNNAEYGEYTSGPKIIDEGTRKRMKEVLARIQSGEYAKEFVLENRAGAPTLLSRRRMTAELPIEKVGGRLREMMPWIKRNRLVDTSKN